jgi:hypothetical protein
MRINDDDQTSEDRLLLEDELIDDLGRFMS